MIAFRIRALASLLGCTALAACSGGSSRVKTAPPPPQAVPAAASEVESAFSLLMNGKEDDARKLLKGLLKRDPMSVTARLLNNSIEQDPKVSFGPRSYAYVARPGDTPAGVAQQLLGNRLLAYQLLRYNELKPPVTFIPGQVLRIPGEPATEPVRRPETAVPRPTPGSRAIGGKPKPVAPKPATTHAPVADPAAARAARAAGLAALNSGQINRAVASLRRAASLDPANPLIARDLARAERIAATVRARQ